VAYTKDPRIRELVDYAKKYNFLAMVSICIRPDGRFEVLSIGDTAANCKKTKPVGDKVFEMMLNSEIEFPDY
jgi:hypothetical protein